MRPDAHHTNTMVMLSSVASIGSRAVRSTTFMARSISSVITPIPVPAKAANAANHPDVYNKTPEEFQSMNRTGEESDYKLGKHRSNAMELVHQYPVIEVEGNMAICDGGGGALGHPLEYISLERPGAVEYCKYCALRFTKKAEST